VFNILIKLQRQKTAAFAAMYHLKRVTVAILNCVIPQFCCIMNRNIKPFKQTVFFIGTIKCFAVLNGTARVLMLYVNIDIAPQSFCHSFIALPKITLFEVSSEIRCSGVSRRCCCYGNYTAGSKPI